MYPISDRFVAALRKPQTRSTVVTVTPPGGSAQTLRVRREDGNTVTLDSNQRIRRKALLSVYATAAQYEAIAAPAALFRVTHGLAYGPNLTELVPVFTGELTRAARVIGGGDVGTVALPLQDLGGWIDRTRFLTAWTVAAGTARWAAIAAMVTDSRPGTVVTNLSTAGGSTGADQVFTDSRWDAIGALATDGGLEAFFGPDGAFVIRDAPLTTTTPIWTATGTLKSVSRERPLDKLYNTVVVRPSASDGSQTWSQQIAQVTATSNPRHPSKIGVVPYFYASPTIQTSDQALAVAVKMLDRVLGTTESLNLDAISNPALEGSDVILVGTPAINTERARSFRHFIDTASLDLIGGGMTLATRSRRDDPS